MLEDLHPKPSLPARLGLSGQPLPTLSRALFAGVAELPVLGVVLKPVKEAAAALAQEKDDRALCEKLDKLLSVGEQMNERAALLEAFAQVILANLVEIQAFLHSQGTEASADELTAFAREMALSAYINRTAGEHMHADHRGVVDADRDAHAASIPLDEVYTPPLLLPMRDIGPADERERELLETLLDREAVPAGRREQLETEYAALTGRRWRSDGAPEGALSLGRALGPARHAVVIGGPGAGKSTLTRFLARAAALGPNAMQRRLGWAEPLVPVLIPLALFAEACREQPGLRLRAYLDQWMLDAGGEPLRDAVADALRDGRAWLLLDGVDEVSDYDARVRLVQAVDAFIAHHPEARVLVTSRPYGYMRLRGPIPHFTLSHFTPRQVTRFVVRWHRARERSRHPEAPDRRRAHRQAGALLREIARNPHVSELTANPLMLVIAALVSLDGTRLPQKRVQLYDRVVHTLMDTWNRWRSLLGREAAGVMLPPEQMLRVWGAVAVWTREGNTGVVHRAVLERRVASVLREIGLADREAEVTAQGYLRAAADRAGILEERATGIFSFWHPTFEEFLAAVELATPASGAVDRLLPLADDPRWREVILLAVGYLGIVRRDRDAATEVVLALLDREPPLLEPLFHERLRLAAACVADGVPLRQRATEAVLERLADAAHADPHYWLTRPLQLALEAALLAEPSARLVDKLLLASREPVRLKRPVVRFLEAAVEHSEPARNACALLVEEREGLYTDAALALARAGDVRHDVRQALLNPSTHAAAFPPELAGFFEQAPEALWRGYEDDLATDDPEVRYRAAAVLCECGRKSAAALAVLQALAAAGGRGVGLAASRRLRDLEEHTAGTKAVLRRQLAAEWDEDRLQAAAELVSMDPSDEEAVATLKALARGAADRSHATAAMWQLKEIGRVDDDLVGALKAQLREPEPERRMDAALWLSFLEIVDYDLLDALRDQLREGRPGAQWVAASLLLENSSGTEDRDTVVHTFRELASGDFPAFQQLSVEQLAASGLVDNALLDEMRLRLDDAEPRVRMATAKCLDKLHAFDLHAVRTTEELLSSPEDEVARDACVLLFTTGHFGRSAREAALRLLANESNWHPLREAGLLGAFSDSELRPVLEQTLRPGPGKPEVWALEHLVDRGLVDEGALDLWLRAMNGADDRGAAACLRVLRREPLSPDDVAVLADLSRPDPDEIGADIPAASAREGAEARREARYWFFAWLRRMLLPQQSTG